jgi:hypothetical protein
MINRGAEVLPVSNEPRKRDSTHKKGGDRLLEEIRIGIA